MSAMHSDELGPGSNWLNCLLESGKGPEILCGHCDERAAALLCALCVPEVNVTLTLTQTLTLTLTFTLRRRPLTMETGALYVKNAIESYI